MFESAELGHAVDKETFERELPALREALLDAQFELAEGKKASLVLVVGGVDGAGKRETVNTLNEWMDPRHIHTFGYDEPTDEERERPDLWRYWRLLPPRGETAIFHGSWYTKPIIDRVYGASRLSEFARGLDRVRQFERMLVDEGVIVLKFWMHLSRAAQKKRLAALEKDPRTRWRVTDRDWKHFELYDRFRGISEHALRETSTAEAPWTIVEATDARYQSMTVGRTVLAALRGRLDRPGERPRTPHLPPPPPAIDKKSLISALDLTPKLAKKAYETRLEEQQGRLSLTLRSKRFQKRSLVLAFEGMDAAGKGGAIRRVSGALDARQYGIVPVAAPTEEERARPYLWRFWRHLPRKGKVAIFDRSWYGRVLVERVEGFCAEADWTRAYSEINEFEEQLHESGVVLLKFWLHVSQEEQLRRFQERESLGFKRFKITPDDWRNRERWPVYELAVNDMLERTGTDYSPWVRISAEDKYHARIAVLEAINRRLEQEL